MKIKVLAALGFVVGAMLLLLGACSQLESKPTATPSGQSATSPQTQQGTSLPGGASGVAGSYFGMPILQPGYSTQQTGIWVSGIGRVSAVPDLAILSIGVEARANTVEEARSQAAAAMDKIIAALTAHGLSSKDIRTQYYSIYPITTWVEIFPDCPKGTPIEVEKCGRSSKEVILGYRVSNTATAKIRKLDDVGRIIDDVAKAGGDLTRIQGVSFTIEDTTALQTQARENAVKDAISKAQQFATLAGVKLGKLVYISESGGAIPIYRADMLKEGIAAMATPEPITPISGGEMEVSISVQAVFGILE
ncbi:MAG: SIMPL domain-containing protein [Chloroflexi bacterium]|nr:SIMPL domain-containing protein [Chloroflexota bacterium]